MSGADETGYGLLVSFSGIHSTPEEDRAFVYGVEFGMLWSRMQSGKEAVIKATTHEANRVVIARAAASQGWHLECKPSGTPTWDSTTMTKKKAFDRPNPHGLRAI